jgi:hypothetical protein
MTWSSEQIYVQQVFKTVKFYYIVHVARIIAIHVLGEDIIAEIVRAMYPLNMYLNLFEDTRAVQQLYNKMKSENKFI